MHNNVSVFREIVEGASNARNINRKACLPTYDAIGCVTRLDTPYPDK